MTPEDRIEQAIKTSLRRTGLCSKMRESKFDKFFREFKVRFWYEFAGVIVDTKTPIQRKRGNNE